MTPYEQTKQLTQLNELLREWNQAKGSPDLADRGEWVNGVVYGIKIVIHALCNEFKKAA